jgi:hypothetical protein
MSSKVVQRKRVVASTHQQPTSSAQHPGDRPDDSIYQPRHPALLLLSFAVAVLALTFIAYHFYQLRLQKHAAASLAHQERDMQLSLSRQVELNAGTKEKWWLYEEHRGNVTSILKSLVPKRHAQQQDESSASLAILGAGNLNDVLLSQLLPPIDYPTAAHEEYFDSLALIDLDAAAMQRGLLRQQQEIAGISISTSSALDASQLSRIRLYSSELTGSFSRFDRWRKDRLRQEAFLSQKVLSEKAVPTQSDRERTTVGAPKPVPPQRELEEWQAELQMRPGVEYRREKGLPQLDARGEKIHFSAVASICLLSQLLDMYMRAVDEHHTGFLPGALSLREAHLALMLDLLQPGGRGMLITDIVASTSIPELRNMTQKDLPPLLQKLIDTSNFFTGTNPIAISRQLAAHPDVQPGSVEVRQPWKWTIGGDANKQFLVYELSHLMQWRRARLRMFKCSYEVDRLLFRI